jgi:hypothetical protein
MGQLLHVEVLARGLDEQLDASDLIGASFTDDDYPTVIDSWTFPLHSVDLDPIAVDAECRRLVLEGRCRIRRMTEPVTTEEPPAPASA